MGVSLPTLYRRAKNDADFPTIIKLGPRISVIDDDELDAYVARRKAVAA